MHDSESDSDEPRTIKVTDRRLFDSDGNFRDGIEVAESSSETTETAAEAAPPHDQPDADAAPQPATPERLPDPPTAAVEETAPKATDDVAQPMVFGEEALMRFVEEQYIGGLLALGAMPEPQSGQLVEDLDLAQVRIEVLGMLQERAGDSLPPEARKGLDDVVYQLRMAYLQKSKVAKL